MRRTDRWWSGAIVAWSIAVGTLAFADVDTPARPLLALGFLLVCPGLAIARLLRLGDGISEAMLAICLSLTVDTLAAAALLYAGHWSPNASLAIVIAITDAACLLRGVGWPGRPAQVRVERAAARRTPRVRGPRGHREDRLA